MQYAPIKGSDQGVSEIVCALLHYCTTALLLTFAQLIDHPTPYVRVVGRPDPGTYEIDRWNLGGIDLLGRSTREPVQTPVKLGGQIRRDADRLRA